MFQPRSDSDVPAGDKGAKPEKIKKIAEIAKEELM